MTNLKLLPVAKTDIQLIDEQHILLINHAKKIIFLIFNEKEKIEINKSLEKLICYMNYHFRAKEELMIKYNYPNILWHKKEHDNLFKKTIKYHDEFIQDTPNIEIEIRNFLTDWINNHINNLDIKNMQNVTDVYSN